MSFYYNTQCCFVERKQQRRNSRKIPWEERHFQFKARTLTAPKKISSAKLPTLRNFDGASDDCQTRNAHIGQSQNHENRDVKFSLGEPTSERVKREEGTRIKTFLNIIFTRDVIASNGKDFSPPISVHCKDVHRVDNVDNVLCSSVNERIIFLLSLFFKKNPRKKVTVKNWLRNKQSENMKTWERIFRSDDEEKRKEREKKESQNKVQSFSIWKIISSWSDVSRVRKT